MSGLGAGAVDAAATRPGLRERKKRQTREAIAMAALELFDRQGFRATTIAQIAAAADVSPRTVSAYFPAKEDLVFPHRHELFARLRVRLRSRRPGELAADALRAWIADNYAELEDRRADAAARMRRRVIDGDEALRAWEHAVMEEGEELLASAFAQDLGIAAGDPAARLAAAATLAALTTAGRLGEERAADGPPAQRRELGMAVLDQALAFIRGGVRELQAQRARTSSEQHAAGSTRRA